MNGLKELIDAIEYLESCDLTPSKENIKKILQRWSRNLYSHVGKEAHERSSSCGIEDETEMTWEM